MPKLPKHINIPSIITTILSILGLSTLIPISIAKADNICDNPNVANEIKAASGCKNVQPVNDLPNAVIDIINAVIFVLGIVAAAFIIFGGIQYMTSAGDSSKIKKAKDTILYAVIGLIICILAFAIVNFVIRVVD